MNTCKTNLNIYNYITNESSNLNLIETPPLFPNVPPNPVLIIS